jgi:phage terminase large subunit-like protein
MNSYVANREYLRQLRYFALQALSEGQRETLAGWPIEGPYGLRRWLASRSVEAFAKLYFPTEFTLPFAPIHHQMLQDMQEVKDRLAAGRPGLKLARAIPRNHAKSTFYSRLLPLHGFLYGWSSLTVLLGNNDDSAKRLVGNIKVAIETNPLLAIDFPLTEIKGSSWGIERLENNSGGVITSYGVGSGAVRGISTGENRPSLVILDDIDDDRSVRSAIELANNIEWFDKSVSAIGDNVNYTTSFIAVGTIIRKTSLLKYIIDSAEYNRIVEQRIKQWSTSPRWDEWQTQYLELARNNQQPKDASEDVFYQQHKAEMLANTQVLWDKADEYYYAMVYKLAHGSKAFSSEMQNDPLDNDSILGNIPYISLSTVNEAEYDLLAALDPTVVGGKKNDLAAYVEVLFHRKRKEIIVSYVDAKQRTYGQTIDTIIKRIQSRGKIYNGLWIEDNAHGLIVKDLLNEKLRQNRLPYIANGVYNTQPKNDRIGALSEYIERGQLLFADNLPQEAIDELSMYPMAGHDDVLDAIATIVLYLKEKNLLTLIK